VGAWLDAQILHQLRHPKVVNFYGAVTENTARPCIVFERCACSVYAQLVKHGRASSSKPPHLAKLNFKTRVRYALDGTRAPHPPHSLTHCAAVHLLSTWIRLLTLQLPVHAAAAKGMVFLHQRLIIHRDLKSSNLLIANDRTKTVKICDFSLSFDPLSVARHATDKSMSGNAVGTPGWCVFYPVGCALSTLRNAPRTQPPPCAPRMRAPRMRAPNGT
jgi:serine/threonine protein kinase